MTAPITPERAVRENEFRRTVKWGIERGLLRYPISVIDIDKEARKMGLRYPKETAEKNSLQKPAKDATLSIVKDSGR